MAGNTHTIDAEGRSIGRVASQAALLLRGKGNPSYLAHQRPGEKVIVVNASKAKVLGKKMIQSTHTRYSGYPGGLTKTTWSEVNAKKGMPEIMRHAIAGMLPNNKLKKGMLRNLTIIV